MIRDTNYLKILLITWTFFHVFTLQSQGRAFDVSWKVDGIILVEGLSFYTLGAFAKKHVTPLTNNDISNLNPKNVNPFDRNAIFHENKSLNTLSNYLLMGSILSPVTLFSLKNAQPDLIPILAMYLETGLTTNGITNFAKRSIQRVRPYAYNTYSQLEKKDNNTRYSFFLSHVANTAAFSFLSAYLIDKYVDSKAWKNVAWSSAIVIPAAMGYLRYASGRHFPTDILCGYAIGAAIGFLIPRLHIQKQAMDFSRIWKLNCYGNGVAVIYSF